MTQDGYVDRPDGTDLGDDDTWTGRVSLAFQPSDRFSALITADVTSDQENGPAMELIGIDFTDLSQLQGVVLTPLPAGSVAAQGWPGPMAAVVTLWIKAMGGGGASTTPCSWLKSVKSMPMSSMAGPFS